MSRWVKTRNLVLLIYWMSNDCYNALIFCFNLLHQFYDVLRYPVQQMVLRRVALIHFLNAMAQFAVFLAMSATTWQVRTRESVWKMNNGVDSCHIVKVSMHQTGIFLGNNIKDNMNKKEVLREKIPQSELRIIYTPGETMLCQLIS